MHGPWWLYPLLMCLVLAGIHGYLGIHVLKRKVIFVDLAMAQIAALGAAYAILLGYDPKHPENAVPIYLFSLGFTLAGAAVISLTRMKKERVPHEAFIGIVYASASALAILLLSKSPTEGEQIRHMLVGSLLTVQPSKVWTTAAIYAGIGAFHWVFREKFFALSEDPEAAEKAGISVRLWDFLFYVSFGVVITSSVAVAGVLLVFSYLVVPGAIAVMFSDSTRSRIVIAWGTGGVVSILGMLLSNFGDFPTGPSVVAAFAAVLVVAGLVHTLTAHERSGAAVRRLVAGGAIVALAIWGTTFLRKEERHEHRPEDPFTNLVQALKSANETEVLQALDHIAAMKEQDKHFVEHVVDVVKRTRSDQVLDHAAEALARLDDPAAIPVLKEAATRDLDAELRVHLARALLDLRDPGGFAVLIAVLDSGPPEFARKEAVELAQDRTGLKLDEAGLRKWWAERGPSLRWRSASRRFE